MGELGAEFGITIYSGDDADTPSAQAGGPD
jgi:hypothetical protein